MRMSYPIEIRKVRELIGNKDENYERIFDILSEEKDVIFKENINDLMMFLSDQYGVDVLKEKDGNSIKNMLKLMRKILLSNSSEVQ